MCSANKNFQWLFLHFTYIVIISYTEAAKNHSISLKTILLDLRPFYLTSDHSVLYGIEGVFLNKCYIIVQ